MSGRDWPDGLVEAVRAGAEDPSLPPQGYPALRDHLLAGGPEPEDLDDWLAGQSVTRAHAAALLERASGHVDENGIPVWFTTWWWPVLRMPWAEDLAVAVVAGSLAVDG